MAQKIKKWEEWLSLSGETAKVISYADYFARRPLFTSLQIKNASDEFVTGLTLTISADNGMLIPFEKSFEEIPFESVIKVELGNILSPFYFSSVEEVKEERIYATLSKDKKVVCTAEWTVKTLPFDFWQGIDGDPTLLASFVRPRLADCVKLQEEITVQLKKWNADFELGGYVGNDKNAVRRVVAGLYATLRKYAIAKKDADITKPVEAGAGVKILSERKASSLEMAILACSVLEYVGLQFPKRQRHFS